MELIEDIKTEKFQRVTYKYENDQEFDYHRITMRNSEWNIDQWDEKELVISYCKFTCR